MAARRKFGMHLNIIANMDRIDGGITLKKALEVVNLVMEPVSPEEYRLAQREQRPMEMRASCDSKGYPLKENSMQILLSEGTTARINASHFAGLRHRFCPITISA